MPRSSRRSSTPRFTPPRRASTRKNNSTPGRLCHLPRNSMLSGLRMADFCSWRSTPPIVRSPMAISNRAGISIISIAIRWPRRGARPGPFTSAWKGRQEIGTSLGCSWRQARPRSPFSFGKALTSSLAMISFFEGLRCTTTGWRRCSVLDDPDFGIVVLQTTPDAMNAVFAPTNSPSRAPTGVAGPPVGPATRLRP